MTRTYGKCAHDVARSRLTPVGPVASRVCGHRRRGYGVARFGGDVSRRRFLGLLSAPIVLLGLAEIGLSPVSADAAEGGAVSSPKAAALWWKGQIHCHSLWSDGDHYPEMVFDRYKRLGCQFVSLTDHNVLSEGDKWINAAKAKGGLKGLADYRARFGESVQTRKEGDTLLVRLKTLKEIRPLFEEPGRFCIIQGEEITGDHERVPVHMNAINLRKVIDPQRGKDIPDTIEKDAQAVLAQEKKIARPVLAVLNHPNWRWSLTAEEMLAAPSVRFFEVFNGGPGCRNYGDDTHAGLERVWDIILAHRLTRGNGGLLYAVATDDAHVYTKLDLTNAIPGRGWVVVRSAKLSPDALVRAMKTGDFYASTGVALKDLRFDGKTLHVEVEPEGGVTYTTSFIGTYKGCDLSGKPVEDAQGKPSRVTHRYSPEIGRVLAEVKGTSATYTFTGKELYVRAKVVSSKPKRHPHAEGDTEVAWMQPVVPGRAGR